MKILLLALGLPFCTLLVQAQNQSTEANAVVEKPAPFTARVSELTTSGFMSVGPNGAKQTNLVTAKTEIKKGDKSAVFGDLKLGDVVTGTRTKTPKAGEWDVLKITNFVSEPAKSNK
jgi:hypothetical protein